MRCFHAIVLCLLLCGSLCGAGFVMPPYLQALTPTGVYVFVESDLRDSVTVEFGADTTYGLFSRTEGIVATTASPTTYVHRVYISGLSPNTLYHYRAVQGADTSRDSQFRTAVSRGTPFRLVWMSDCRTNSAIFDSIVVRMKASKPLLALYGGDLCAEPDYGSWKQEFFRREQIAFGAVVPWANATGNHEDWTADTRAFTQAPSDTAGNGYYSFDCGDLHVLVLNNQGDLSEGSPQYRFAESDLAAAQSRWKIVTMHYPAYCAGGHGEESTLTALTTAVFEKRGVHVVLAGHSHFYQHNVVHGIHHLVIGSAGAPLYDPEEAAYTVKSLKEYNWATCDVTETSLELKVFNERGAILDTLLLGERPAEPALPDARQPGEHPR